jgi:hypothetical protein
MSVITRLGKIDQADGISVVSAFLGVLYDYAHHREPVPVGI